MAKGLWKFVDFSAVLAEDASGVDREKFWLNNKWHSLLSCLCRRRHCYTLSPPASCLRMLVPKDAWDTIKKHFERDTLANKFFLKKL